MKKLTLLNISFNDGHHILELLESLKSSSYKDYDFLIWDNNSTLPEAIKDREKLEKTPNVKLIRHDKNSGFTGGVNGALKNIKTKYVLLLNPDTILDKDTIKEMLELIESNEKIAFVSAAIYNYKDRNKIDSFGGKMSFFTGIGTPLKIETETRELKYGEYCDACCMMFNREVFEELGGYDDKYFAYAETEDVLFKAMKQGYKVYIHPKAKIWHKLYGSSGGKRSKITTYLLARNRILLMKKHLSLLRFGLFLFLNLFMLTPVQTLLFVKRRQFDLIPSYFKGIWHGLTGKYGASFFNNNI
jgi:GT2 family glycosyltransferase